MERSRKNCDRFDTLDQAREAYHEECCYWFGGYDGVGGTYIKKNKEPSFEKWLFEKAKENVTDCNRLGNADSIRDALDKILWCLEWMSDNAENKSIKDHLTKPIELAKSALSALLNCAEKEAPFTTESGMSIAMDMARKAIAKAGGEA